MKKLNRLFFGLSAGLVLSGCSSFMGLRQPLYDGQSMEPKQEAIDIYEKTGEIIGEEKEYYFRYPFSQDIYQPSLEYTENEPVLLTDGEYVIGEDLPAGRVSLLGNESSFISDSYEAHVGNFKIYDPKGEVYFENLFHSLYGPLIAQVDLQVGHTIEIIGNDTEISAFYTENFPKNPYELMDPPEVLENLGRIGVEQPLTKDEDTVRVTAGIYEVGVHLEAGTYEVLDVFAPQSTELYLFREGEEPRVFELTLNEMIYNVDEEEMEEMSEKDFEDDPIQIELQDGDKIYPNLVSSLILSRVADN
ncbi:MAG TPA: hypothetical protein H9808_03580 [Candidatus Atopostipes pullistercoris]|uniref:Lipoprotein n=1 Tax=Candidatus Atopostipes pullistercoris TaxID=2838467 RepID=A0A9D2JX34_9LACT|nr:hypothetical protein [Candidatus Atopostipes pullistercoris]